MVKLMHKYIYLFLGCVDEPGKDLSIILAPPAAYFPEKHYEKLYTFTVGNIFRIINITMLHINIQLEL